MQINPEELTDHDREMIKVAEGGDPNAPDDLAAVTPEGDKPTDGPALPDGFKSVDELIAWYNEQAADDGDADEEGESTEEEPEVDAKSDTEADEEPTLSDAEVELREMKAYEAVGGRETYAEMVNWAKTALTEDQIAIYDDAVNGLDNNVAMLAVQGFHAMYQLSQMQAFGSEGELTYPSNAGLQVAQGFQTQSEMMAAMADPRYQSDESFNRMVMQKLALTNF